MTQNENNSQTAIVATESVNIPNGNYEGQIVDVTRDKQNVEGKVYDYIRVGVQPEIKDCPVLNVSWPSTISENSGLGQLIKSFADIKKLVKGESYDPADILTGRKCSFTIKNEASKKNPNQKFANIVRESVVPL